MNITGCQDGAKIRELRKRRGYSAAELAGRVGINMPSLCNIELGRRPASIGTLVKIARALGVLVDELIRDEADDEPEAAQEAA